MASNYFSLPRPSVGDQGLNLNPLTQLANDYGQNVDRHNALMQRQQEIDYRQQRDAKQDQRQATQDQFRIAESLAKRADAVGRLPAEQRGAAWNQFLTHHKRYFPSDQLDPEDLDPMTGPARYAAAFGGISRDPREDQLANLKLQGQQLDNQYRQAQIESLRTKSTTDQTREQKLVEMGIDPNSAEGLAFIANGKLPQAAVQQMLARQQRQQTAPKIAEGLTNLLNMTDQYDDAAFTNAVGPMQGVPPDGGLLTAPFANIARGWGEFANAFEGGNARPSEVRSNIQGSTEALAAAIKPLIRGPGEGVWTDADQARLVSIVGDLAQSSDKAEFRRRLNAVRDRVQSNFGLDVPFEALAHDLQPRPPMPTNRSGRAGGNMPVRSAPSDDGFKVEFD